MTDEQRSDQQTGTGSPRTAGGVSGEPAELGAEVEESVLTGATSTSDPARGDDLEANRSGSGGSGGPAEADPSVEGSTGETMAELLGGEESARPEPEG
jgi:hypothetical protein